MDALRKCRVCGYMHRKTHCIQCGCNVYVMLESDSWFDRPSYHDRVVEAKKVEPKINWHQIKVK